MRHISQNKNLRLNTSLLYFLEKIVQERRKNEDLTFKDKKVYPCALRVKLLTYQKHQSMW